MHTYMYTHVHTYGGRKSVFCVFLLSQLYFFDTRSLSLNLEVNPAKLWPVSPGDPPVSAFPLRG